MPKTNKMHTNRLNRLISTIPVMIFATLSADARIWTDTKNRTIEADIVRADAENVIVNKGGKEVTIAINTLSTKDVHYIATWTKDNSAPKAMPPATPVATTPAAKPAPVAASVAKPGSYYDPSYVFLFQPYPSEKDKKPWLVRNLGPVGIGINLIRPGMTMQINNVEPGSPAAATGKLQKGQIIESINGKILQEIDPRIILGDIITEAEATDGKMTMKIQGVGDVTVNIPIMGAYSATWPVNCPKSDKIVRNLADLIGKLPQPNWGSALFLLSTGEEKDLNVVRKWMSGIKTVGGYNWHKGYIGLGLCEYYLRTGDQSVLPVISKMCDELKANMYSGGWSGRGTSAAFTYSTGSGQVHASGVHCMTFVLMSKLCGADVDQYMYEEAFRQFYRFAGHGNVAYGNGIPEGGFRDNGKSSGLAMGLAAAAMIHPDGEESVFAKARDNTSMKAFYATNWFHAAHTGGGMGEIWHHAAVSQMREKRPNAYRTYLDTRRWVMDSSRRFDGGIGIAGMDDRYDRSTTEDPMDWGTFFALTYTFPRKHLQLFGAPRSKWAKKMDLPRPWGNETDDVFHSVDPIPGGPLTKEELGKETIGTADSVSVISKLNDPKLPDETLMKYIYHPEYDYRSLAMDQVVKRGKVDMVLPLLQSTDSRLRQAGLLALTGMFKGAPLPAKSITPAMYEEVGKILNNKDEAWWTTFHAATAIGRGGPELTAKHRDRLLELLDYKCTWTQTAAAVSLTQIASDSAHYQKVLPAIAKFAANVRVDASSYQISSAMTNAMKTAPEPIKEYAMKTMKDAYTSIPKQITEPKTNAPISGAGRVIRSRIGGILKVLPQGEDYVRRIPRTTLESYISGKESDMYAYSGTFTPNKSVVGTWAWAIYPQPTKPAEIDSSIQNYLKPRNGKSPDPVIKNPKDLLQIIDGGTVAKSKFHSGYFWSGDRLIGMDDDQALKMEVRTVEGRDFLIVERGGYNVAPTTDDAIVISKDWHCGYSIYERQP